MAAAAALAAPTAAQSSLGLDLRIDPFWYMQDYMRTVEPKPGAAKGLAKILRRQRLEERSRLILRLGSAHPKLMCAALEEEFKVVKEAKREIRRLRRKMLGKRVTAVEKSKLRRSIKSQGKKMKRAVDDDIEVGRLVVLKERDARLQALGLVPK